MKRLLLISAGILAAGGLATAPAIAGLTDNPSFSHQIPIRVPTQVRFAQAVDDSGSDAATVPAGPASTTRSRHVEPGDDRGTDSRHPEPGDDRGGSSRSVEPGDDRGGAHHSDEAGHRRGDDDNGGTSRHGGDDARSHG